MLSAYRTLAATGRILGVSAERVAEFVDHGPLVARVFEDGRRLIHDDDLRAFRRPLFVTASESTGYSTLCQLAGPDPREDQRLTEAKHVDTGQERVVTESFGVRRGTMATKVFRALADVDDVRRQGERFLTFVSPDPNTGCHLWTGCVDKRHGYGYFRLWPQKTVAAAHRVAWVIENGRLPERVDVDHLCHERSCVNPRHLQAVTHAENIRRRDVRRADLGLPDNLAIARAARSDRKHLRLVRA